MKRGELKDHAEEIIKEAQEFVNREVNKISRVVGMSPRKTAAAMLCGILWKNYSDLRLDEISELAGVAFNSLREWRGEQVFLLTAAKAAEDFKKNGLGSPPVDLQDLLEKYLPEDATVTLSNGKTWTMMGGKLIVQK